MSIEDAIRVIVKQELALVIQEIKIAIESLKDHRKQAQYITRKEAAKLLRISLPTLDKMINDDKLKVKRIGRKVLIDETSIT